MKIKHSLIGPHVGPYIVAEIGANHNGSAQEGYRLIEAAADCGADAVKIQCYTADSICINAGHVVQSETWKGQDLHALYKSAETPPKLAKDMFLFARKHNVTLFSSVFDFDTVDFVSRLGMPAIKIASFELVDTPLIEYAAKTGLPMIISTGMGSSKEVMDAINAYNFGNGFSGKEYNLALLHCVSSYPANPRETNLPALGPLSSLLGGRHVVGFSDHTLGFGSAVGAVAFGASIIEKHFILDRSSGGPDASFSMEPSDFSALVTACNEAWQAIQPSASPVPNLSYRKSIFAVEDVACGDTYSTQNCRILRPALGLPPCFYPRVLGAVALRDVKAGTPLSSELVSSLC